MTTSQRWWPADPAPQAERQPERMIRALQDDRRKVGTVLAIPLADGRLLGVAVRSDGTVRLFPPDRPPVDLPSAGAALLGQILNRPEGGDS